MTDEVVTWRVSNSGKPIIDKAPGEHLDYTEDWTDWLAEISPTSRIADHTITPLGTMTCSESDDDGLQVTAMLDGGALGETEAVEMEIVTDDNPPRTSVRTLYFKIKVR